MTKARLFMTGGSQAVRLPAEFRFEDRRSISGAIPSRGRWCFRSPPAWSVRHGGVERCRSNLLSRLQSIAFGAPRLTGSETDRRHAG